MKAIDTNGLTKRYPDDVAVVDLHIQIQSGEVFGFVGPNGAGKSTTIAMLLGLRTPTAGTVRVLGIDPAADAVSIRSRVGALPENGGLLGRVSGRAHLSFLQQTYEIDESPMELLSRVGLSEAAGRRNVGGYSSGMAQRLRLAMALLGEPDLLVLDEPAANLDPDGIVRLREMVRTERDRGAAIFFSSHQLDDVAALCDRVGFLVDGRLEAVTEGDKSPESLATQYRDIVRRA